jgi:glucosyl-3-phosphoglycerate synthase
LVLALRRVSISGVNSRSLAPRATLCIPAHNEESTIVGVVRALRRAARHSGVHIEEVLVVDDRSSDRTARRAASAGARVVATEMVCRPLGGARGKGDAIWAGLRECRTDLVAFVDADIQNMDARRVVRMLDRLAADESAQLVKGVFQRTNVLGEYAAGRVTTLTAKPLLNLLFPAASHLREPLGGMFAGRTEALGAMWLDCDYGVDVGILLDIIETYGMHSVVEVELGQLQHRQRPLAELAAMAEQVARAILSRREADAIIDVALTARRQPPRRLVPEWTNLQTLG